MKNFQAMNPVRKILLHLCLLFSIVGGTFIILFIVSKPAPESGFSHAGDLKNRTLIPLSITENQETATKIFLDAIENQEAATPGAFAFLNACLDDDCVSCDNAMGGNEVLGFTKACLDDFAAWVKSRDQKVGEQRSLSIWSEDRLRLKVPKQLILERLESLRSDAFILIPLIPGHVYEVYVDMRKGSEPLPDIVSRLAKGLEMSLHQIDIMKFTLNFAEEGWIWLRAEKSHENGIFQK